MRVRYVKITYVLYKQLSLLKEYVAEEDLYFILDETTYACSRRVLSILVGKLNGLQSKAMLLKSYVLQSVNTMDFSQAFINCLYSQPSFIRTSIIRKLHSPKIIYFVNFRTFPDKFDSLIRSFTIRNRKALFSNNF